MKADLKYQNFENIKIQNTSLRGANFAKCNLSGSVFENVDISWMNLNGAILFNCKWKNLKIYGELNRLDGHKECVNSVCFSPDGNTLASCSGNIYGENNDNSIRLWDVKTGQQKSKLDGHSSYVNSVCFSPDGNTLGSGSDDNSICLWDVKTGHEIQSTDKSYQDILAQFKSPLFQNNLIFQAQGALILNGEFVNQSSIDLKTLFKQNGSFILENQLELQ